MKIPFGFLCFFYLVSHFLALCKQIKEWSVTAIENDTAHLPCLLNPRSLGDKPKLVLWYKRHIKSPVLSYDGRLPHLLKSLAEGSPFLNLTSQSASLLIFPATSQDAGIYECRVDFFQSPTHNSITNLTVIELPKDIRVEDERARAPMGGAIGPFLENSKLALTCSVKGGFPSANVTWLRNERVLDSMSEEIGKHGVKNVLRIPKLTRNWNNASLVCRASNTDLVPPILIKVTLHLYLLPVSVEINPVGAVLEGKILRLRCSSRGSDPPATLTWYINGTKVKAEKENTHYEGVTTSTLVVEATRKLNNAKVTCTAINRDALQYPLSNYTKLSVHYPPSISASLGKSVMKTHLKEGYGVYFICNVDANPSANVIQWFHEDRLQIQNVSQGIIITGDSLVLQNVNRRQIGKYRCRASNSLAKKDSNWVSLKLRYKPQCETPETTFFLYDQPINVTCTVSAFPLVSSIQWRWNSSKETFSSHPIPLYSNSDSTNNVGQHYDRSASFFSVSPRSRYEERELTCYGINELGTQDIACKFAIKVAKMPAPLSACRLANITASSLSLTCEQPIHRHGGSTSYRAEVYLENQTLFYNVTSSQPNFNVSRLDPATNYQIKVYVSRGPVTSPPVVVSAYTSRSSRREEGSSRVYSSSRNGVLAGCLTTALVFLVCFLSRIYYHRTKRRDQNGGGSGSQLHGQEENNKNNTIIDSKVSSEETNPDVVPNIEETYDLLSCLEAKREQDLYKAKDNIATEFHEREHENMYQPLTLLPSLDSASGIRTFDRSMRAKNTKEDVYCAVDQIFQAEESVV